MYMNMYTCVCISISIHTYIFIFIYVYVYLKGSGISLHQYMSVDSGCPPIQQIALNYFGFFSTWMLAGLAT